MSALNVLLRTKQNISAEPSENFSFPFEFFMRFSITTVSGTLSLAEKTYLTSKVRGRSSEDPRPKGQWPRGVTPRPRPGAVARRSNLTSKEDGLCGGRRV